MSTTYTESRKGLQAFIFSPHPRRGASNKPNSHALPSRTSSERPAKALAKRHTQREDAPTHRAQPHSGQARTEHTHVHVAVSHASQKNVHAHTLAARRWCLRVPLPSPALTIGRVRAPVLPASLPSLPPVTRPTRRPLHARRLLVREPQPAGDQDARQPTHHTVSRHGQTPRWARTAHARARLTGHQVDCHGLDDFVPLRFSSSSSGASEREHDTAPSGRLDGPLRVVEIIESHAAAEEGG